MKRIIFRVVGLSIVMGCVACFANAEEKSLMDEVRIIKQGEGEVREKKDDEKVIERYYYKKEVIKEVPEEKGKYEKHLFDELKSRLDKPKYNAEVWRVEGDLIELNKGSIHKVREGDVYKIYGKQGRYKGKMEVSAIADAVSIGRHLNKYHLVEKSDTALYVGQRRFWGSGLLYGFNIASKETAHEARDYTSYGLYWRFLFSNSWGIGASFVLTRMNPNIFYNLYGKKATPPAWNKYPIDWTYADSSQTTEYAYVVSYNGDYRFVGPFDVRKYFFHPAWYSSYVGVGGAYFTAKYTFKLDRWSRSVSSFSNWDYQTVTYIDNEVKKIIPALTGGTELALGSYFRLVFSASYFHGPEITIDGYKEFTRPLMLSIAFVGAW